MPGNNRHRNHSKPSTATAASVANPSASIPLSELPEDIVLSIFKLLPVKSILRSKCVSKQWLAVLSTPKFVYIHREESSKNPLNHSFIIHSKNKDDYHELSLLNVNSTERMPVSLFNPFCGLLKEMKLVGSVNGLVCLSCRKGHMIILWNPAMNLSKLIRFSIPDEDTSSISLGFAYDSVNDDYKIIQIDSSKQSGQALPRCRAKVYSATLDSWKRVQTDFPSVDLVIGFNVIVKGIPYWTAFTYQENRQLKKVLVYYDMRNGSFKRLSLPDLPFSYELRGQFVAWKGNLGAIMPSPDVGREFFLDIMVYDEMGMCWNKISSHGPIELWMDLPIPCSIDGVILTETEDRELMLYDLVTNGVKEFCTPGAPEHYFFEAISYTESLVTIKGMEQVKEQVLVVTAPDRKSTACGSLG